MLASDNAAAMLQQLFVRTLFRDAFTINSSCVSTAVMHTHFLHRRLTRILMCRFCRGLHDFLYSNEEDHGATASDGSVELFDGSSLYQARQRYIIL